MITSVDTNVLLDVFGGDPGFGASSAEALRKCIAQGAIVACEVVWAEAAAVFGDSTRFMSAMATLGITFSPLTEKAALLAGETWHEYRRHGGKRNRVVADFLIGAHTVEQCDRLLTRDRGFYRKYYKGLAMVDPMGLR